MYKFSYSPYWKGMDFILEKLIMEKTLFSEVKDEFSALILLYSLLITTAQMPKSSLNILSD